MVAGRRGTALAYSRSIGVRRVEKRRVELPAARKSSAVPRAHQSTSSRASPVKSPTTGWKVRVTGVVTWENQPPEPRPYQT
jgi:hypothetical protein